jgi:folate-binding protein YgfZ
MNALKISGLDAEKFLQGQVTCNVNALIESKTQICALCNRKGRVIASFNLIKVENYFLMLLAEDMIDIVLNTLSKYAKFAKVTIMSEHYCHPEGRSPEGSPEGYIEITPENSGLFTPHKLNYHLIPGMIDFNKGCYTGQEIIARVHYLSKPKT